MIIILNWLVLNKPLNEYTHNYVCFWQLTYSTTRYGLYEVVSAELRKGNGNYFFFLVQVKGIGKKSLTFSEETKKVMCVSLRNNCEISSV